MKKRISVLILISFFCSFTFFLSCSRSPNSESSRTIRAAGNSVSRKKETKDNAPLWQITEKRVCVLFGYGYNAPESVSAIMLPLSARYGHSEDGGLIAPIIFPDDFRRDTRAVPSDLYEILSGYQENHDLSGIILLGAPERSYAAINRMQDAFEGNLPFPIFSFFPQDDVAGMESAADIVVDRAQEVSVEDMIDVEYDQFIEDDISDILLNALQGILDAKMPITKDAALFEYVQQILSPHRVAHYIDPSTGLRSINHFIFD